MIPDLLASAIVSGLGGLLTFGAARAWRLWRLLHLRQLCSIDGAFVTQFERRVGDEVVIQQAMTQLSQRGLRVRGVTTELSSDRSWHLEGEIDQAGFLRCTSQGDGESDAARTLLLAIERNGAVLSGLWTTCDSAAHQVSSGQALMRRCR